MAALKAASRILLQRWRRGDAEAFFHNGSRTLGDRIGARLCGGSALEHTIFTAGCEQREEERDERCTFWGAISDTMFECDFRGVQFDELERWRHLGVDTHDSENMFHSSSQYEKNVALSITRDAQELERNTDVCVQRRYAKMHVRRKIQESGDIFSFFVRYRRNI